MDFDKTIMQNQHGDYLVIYTNHFNEGIEYACQNKIPQIHLRKALGEDSKNSQIDFKKFEMLSNYLRIICIQDTLEGVVNSDFIHSLKNLAILQSEKQKFTLDISRFENLKHFGGTYWSKLEGIDKACSLTSAVIIKLPDINLERLSGLRNMENLHIYSSKIESLNGIQNLPIKMLTLARNSILEDIEALRELTSLERLSIEKCKKIVGHEIIEELKRSIKVF